MHGGEIIAGSGKTKKVKKDKQSRAMKHGKSGTAAMEDPGKVEVADDVAMDDVLFYESDKYQYEKKVQRGGEHPWTHKPTQRSGMLSPSGNGITKASGPSPVNGIGSSDARSSTEGFLQNTIAGMCAGIPSAIF